MAVRIILYVIMLIQLLIVKKKVRNTAHFLKIHFFDLCKIGLLAYIIIQLFQLLIFWAMDSFVKLFLI
jgi:hypothetical protein